MKKKKPKIPTYEDLKNKGFKYKLKLEKKPWGRKKTVIDIIIPDQYLKIYKQSILNCYRRNKKLGCHKDTNAVPLCRYCPKGKNVRKGLQKTNA